MPERINVPVNNGNAYCDDIGCEYEIVQIDVYQNICMLIHHDPITPWKSNFYDLLQLNRESMIALGHALLKAADRMPEIPHTYDGM